MAGDRVAVDGSTLDHPDMDYPEHEKTYSLFISMCKWGAIFSAGAVILLALITI